MANTKWTEDPVHSEVQFRVRHLMITTVTGYLRKFDVHVETDDDDFTKAHKILFKADINSIDTNNAQRDTHLKSNDFFSADKYPELQFVGKKYGKVGDKYLLQGDLTIRNITKPLNLDVDFGGIVVDPYGQTKAGKEVAVHIHEHGDCGNMGQMAHGHWNPGGAQHGKWGSGSFHAGDIGNIKLDSKGKGKLTLETDLWTLGGNASKNIIGKAIIVHGGVDDYSTQPTGNAGSRIGCGVIR